ncbi:MAG: RidA family protein [Oligoflexia bacterium]|nr:RidA family protein [Oligoflexia bacterium]
MSFKTLLPPGWGRPSGYSNGILTRGQLLFVAGQIGWEADHRVTTSDLADQVKQALQNIVAILKEGGAKPEHLVRLTWYVTDKQEYLAAAKRIGEVYREVIGTHYPAMSLLEVKDLLEDGAKVEIEATAVIPD